MNTLDKVAAASEPTDTRGVTLDRPFDLFKVGSGSRIIGHQAVRARNIARHLSNYVTPRRTNLKIATDKEHTRHQSTGSDQGGPTGGEEDIRYLGFETYLTRQKTDYGQQRASREGWYGVGCKAQTGKVAESAV